MRRDNPSVWTLRFRLFAATLILSAVGIGSLLPDNAFAGTTRPIVLSGVALGPIRIGSSETSAMTRFQKLFGVAKKGLQKTADETNCGIDAVASWPNMQVFFFKKKFIGYNTGYSKTPLSQFISNKGLKIGDTITEAKKIYGTAFRTSSAQGGSWDVDDVARNVVYGYLVLPPRVGPSDRIAGITAGSVGCPAMTP